MRQIIIFGLLWILGGPLYAYTSLTQLDYKEKIAHYFEKHCYKCHGENKQKSDRRFDLLSFPISDEDQLIDYQDALDQLNLGEMPPKMRPSRPRRIKANNRMYNFSHIRCPKSTAQQR